MLTLKALFVLLHIITAAGWFGLAIRIGRQARAAAAAGGSLVDDVTRSVKLMNVFVLLTFLFGLGAIFTGGGFAAYTWPIHTAVTLILVLIAVQFLLVSRPWTKVTAGDAAAARQISMGVGIGHLLWLVLLVLMLWNRYFFVVLG